MVKMNIKQKLKQIGEHTFQYAISGNNDLTKLSPKKRTALNCVTFGINETSMSDNLKQSFFNSAYYMMRMVSDSEVDQIILASGEGCEFYMMNHFYDDLPDKVNGRPNVMKVVMEKYKKSDPDAVLDSQEFKRRFFP